jgi:hypothetical protein
LLHHVNANATRLLASAANSGSNVIFRLGIGVSQTRDHTQTNAITPIVRTVCCRRFFRATESDGSNDALLQSTLGAWTDAPGRRASGQDS